MILSLSTGSLFTLPLQRVFELAAESGFEGVELIINQDFQRVNSVKLVRSLQEITTIHSIHAPFMELDGWGGKIESLKLSIKLAAECNIPLVNFHPPSWMGLEIGFWRWLYSVHDYQKEIGLNGEVIVTLENMPWVGKNKINPNILSNTQRLVDFIAEHNLFMTFDCTHMGSGKTNFINDFFLCYDSGRIRNIHFSDYGHDREHLLPGHGILPLTRFLNHLRSTEYKSTVTLELDPREFPKGENNILASLKEILAYLRKETNPQTDLPREYTQETIAPTTHV
ncbi:MAG: sugar phosphate isomerase/epimerase [Desulfuromonadaceae bacterium]|nr:sugar phosphate isomerase/epimerase [Desulfuromonadaceae bacterium]MDD2855553.1 sugar phosphate isomerase/epimerase [Desulfuromonadaceae bacterium]